MSDNTIREFLVGLGFKVDETSMKKFENSVLAVSKGVAELGLAVTATATGVVLGVKKIADQMEGLYYASQRSGATVQSLMGIRYAAAQVGLSAGNAQEAIESFSRTLRLSPGMNGLLSSLGVTGNDPVEKFQSFIEKTKTMQAPIAAAYASMFGLSPDDLLMYQQGLDKIRQGESDYDALLSRFGINSKQAAKSAVDFNNSFRKLGSVFDVIGVKAEEKLAPVIERLVNQFTDWAVINAPPMLDQLAKWIDSIDWKQVGDDIAAFFETMRKGIDAVGGLGNALLILAGIKLGSVILQIASLASGVGGLTTAFGGLARFFLANPIVAGIFAMTHSENLNQGEDERLKALHARNDAYGKEHGVSATDTVVKTNPTDDEIDAWLAPNKSGGAPRGIRNNNPGNIRYGSFAQQMGATGADSGGFAIFPDMKAGADASMALLHGYAGRGFDTISKIISRWAPSNENDTGAYIGSVSRQLGIDPNQRLTEDQLGGVAQSIFAHENGGAWAARLGTSNVSRGAASIAQTNNITVNGAGDPHATASAVGKEMTRVNADVTRNFINATAAQPA